VSTKVILPQKDSGIPWLGEIPAHWEVKKLKYLASKVGSGITPLGGASVYQTSGVPLLRSQNIHFGGLELDDVAYISEEIDEEMSNSRIAKGDVLLNITGASVGRCYFVNGTLQRGNVNQHVCIIRPIMSRIKTIYLYYLLHSYMGQQQIAYSISGANREGLNFEQIKAFTFGIPDLEEQIKTFDFLEKETEIIGNVQTKISREIELLQEYRTALIRESVTGKIDVRGVS
jgi:type I restriction enzyme S subunit